MKNWTLILGVPFAIALLTGAAITANYMEQGGARWVIGSGGAIDIESGGEIDIESGGALKIAGTAVTASAAELNYGDVTTAGTVQASKAVVVDANKDAAAFRNLEAVKFTYSDLVLESLNPLTVKLNDTDALQFDNAAISSFAAAADTAGNGVYVETEDGGVDTAVDGGSAGALLSVKTGDGSAGGADMDGAAGGSLTITSGAGSAGGAHTANNPDGGDGADITITAGAGGAAGSGGSGVAGDPGVIQLASVTKFAAAQVIDMADAAVTLTLNPGTPTGTNMTSNVLRVDPNSGQAGENLLLPHEADLGSTFIIIVNSGGENVVVQNDAGSTIDTVATAEFGIFFCDGTEIVGQNKS